MFYFFLSVSKQSAGPELVSLAGQEACGLSLEGDDDDSQFEIPLLLQLGQNSSPKEHFTLTDAIEVGIQLQVFYLEENRLLEPPFTCLSFDAMSDHQRNISSPSDSRPAFHP